VTYAVNKIERVAKKIRKWAEERWPYEDLCGMCGIASVMLYNALKQIGIYATIVCNNEHAFLEYDGLAIDITASQYGHGPVVICRMDDVNKNSYWTVTHRFNSSEGFIAHQKTIGWPKEQIYYG